MPIVVPTHPQLSPSSFFAGRKSVAAALSLLLLAVSSVGVRGEAMLQLFNVPWADVTAKMPEIAEAGYTSLWLPPPAKAGSSYSVGYDQFDPFDLGDKNQRGTVRTRYGTKEELMQVMEVAHRFGLRVYFDNIMNHRGFDIPGFNASTPTNLYPGMVPGDFHLKVNGSYYQNWPSVGNWSYVDEVQRQPLFGLVDIANEPGSLNLNFGTTLFNTASKPSLVRHPGTNRYYMDTNLPPIVTGAPWYPFNGNNGKPVAEDVNAYLIRAAMWTLAETRCDGFRFDAVKHVPATFFGDTSSTAFGYTGAIQAMFDAVHGYGNNVLSNGYVEADDNRNSCFDTEAPRNDALLFGEHLGEPPPYQDYLDRGMRLVNSPYHYQLNNILGNPSASLSGMEQRDYKPYGTAFSGQYSVLFAQSHDDDSASHRELQEAYNFTREGLPSIYSDGYNQSSAPDYFPRVANAPYLGEFGDNKMPDVAYLHHQLSRGGTRPRWGDTDIVAYERYDYRDSTVAADQTVLLFAMNDNYSSDISFDDGAGQASAGTYYGCFPVTSSRNQGLVVGFPPGSVLSQLSDSPNKNSACTKLLVRKATQVLSDAQNSVNAANPVDRMIYVGSQTLAAGGGAIELKVPSGGYVMYGYQWPEAARTIKKDAITLRQNGVDAPRFTVYRRDGTNGDAAFNPTYPFKMRGSVDEYGNVIAGANVSNKTYAIDIPILTNANFDVIVRSDASCVNTLLKLDGGTDLNSHMGLGSTNADLRDNRPGAATDIYLGYEQTAFNYRYGPEKFGSRLIGSNTLFSLGAETYVYTVGGTNNIVAGSGYNATLTNSTAAWVQHNPTNVTTVSNLTQVTMRNPVAPANGQAVDLWIKVGYQFNINRCFIYYTTDGSNPEGAFGTGRGTTKAVEAFFGGKDLGDGTIDWWKGTIPGTNNLTGTQIRYKVALFKDNISEIIDYADEKTYGVNQASITNFNPMTAKVWLHNNRNTNDTVTGLREGFHILRARVFLPRTNKSAVFNTFLQTFYYDAAPPVATFAAPASNITVISNVSYQVIIRADSSATGLEYNISDGDAGNDDLTTGQNNGNGTNALGQLKFVSVAPATPTASLNTTYSNQPVEFRFNYVGVPTNGSATITVRVKEATSQILTNRYTTLTKTVSTLAPGQFVKVSDPAADGMTLTLETNDTYTINACFSQALAGAGNIDYFSIFVNGQLLPRRDAFSSPLYVINPADTSCGTGLRKISCDWSGAAVGTNVIQIFYTNSVTLSDTRTVNVVRPTNLTLDSDGDGVPDWQEAIAGTDPHDANSVLRITQLANGNQLVVWDSVPNISYQVLATTNLGASFAPISPVIFASGTSTFYYDSVTNVPNKYYRIQVAQ